METKQFKTNIKCAGCIATVTPFLDKVVGPGNWDVDTRTADKTLTVALDGLDPEKVKDAVLNAGFKATEIVP